MRRSFLFILFALVASGFILERAGFLSPVKSVVARVVTPVTGGVTRAARIAHETASALGGLPGLVRENNRLLAENRRLRAELAKSANIAYENELLRAELGVPSPSRHRQAIAAFIVGRSRTGPFGTFIVDRGAKDGVREGQVVLSEGILVGRIVETWEGQSSLLPITNVNSAIPVVLTESRGIGILKGGLRGLVVEQISRDVTVKPGEAAVTAEMGGIVPGGILVGTVKDIIGNQADVFQEVTISSPLSFNRLELVMIWPRQ